MEPVILEAKNLRLSFGKVVALNDVTLEVRNGEIVALIEPNGARKTSFLNCLSGFYTPDSGQIFFQGKDITKLSPHRRTALETGHTFQGTQLFDKMSVLDNILAGRHSHIKTNFLWSFLYWS